MTNNAGLLRPQDASHIGNALERLMARFAVQPCPSAHKRRLTQAYEMGAIGGDMLAAEIAAHGLEAA